MKENAYKKAGVDIEAGAALVERIKPHVKQTMRDGVMSGLGGFGAFFDPKHAGYTDPVLVSSTDGVGTKLKIAIESGIHETVGIDLVAMCVNDIIVQGAEPLFFLDYFATGKLENDVAETVIKGVAAGCKIAGCALIGGETAEMPGMYKDGEYDLAGFTVGAVSRENILTGENIAAGNVILGLASSGPHSNGYSLVRHLLTAAEKTYADPAPFAEDQSFAEAFLTPTRIYVKPILSAFKASPGTITGLAHITGGGLLENIPRVIPEGLCAELNAESWDLPHVFKWLQQTGGLTEDDLLRTFNCGIGMAVFCKAEQAAAIKDILTKEGETVFEIGSVTKAEDAAIKIANTAGWV